jgi:hypothetical protein
MASFSSVVDSHRMRLVRTRHEDFRRRTHDGPVPEVLDALTASDATDVIRQALQVMLQQLIDAEARSPPESPPTGA